MTHGSEGEFRNATIVTTEMLHAHWAQVFAIDELWSQDKRDKILERSKAKLLLTKPGKGFLGSLMCDHTFVWDLSAPTAWCNGVQIGWNPYFFQACSPDGRIFVNAHEVWHSGYDHMNRLGSRDAKLWNIAADHVINNMLMKEGFCMEPEDLAGIEVCRDPKFRHMSTEQAYAHLYEENPPLNPQGPCSMNGSGDGTDPTKGGQGGPDDDGSGGNQGMDGDLAPLPEEVSIAEQMGKIVKAKQAHERNKQGGLPPGDIPGEVETLIKEFLNPVLPWTTILRNHLSDMSNDDWSWRRPSRRSEDDYLPSMFSEDGLERAFFYNDVSGSVSDDDMLRTNSESKAVFDEFNPSEYGLITFDCEIQNEIYLEKDDHFESMVITGRGGTSFHPVFEHMKEHQPKVAIIISDMGVSSIPEDVGIPVIWIVFHRNGEHFEPYPDFGRVIHIPEEDMKKGL